MPDPVLIDKTLFLQSAFVPAAVNWNRLEGRPRKEDFERSLRVEVRDPLWMICRQWQFGEFRGENAGSAIKATLQLDTGRIDSYAAADSRALPYDDAIPLEVRIEREPVPMSLAVRTQIGRHFIRLLGSLWGGEIRSAYLARYFMETGADSEKVAHLASDSRARAYYSAVSGRIPDGARLLDEIGDGAHESFVFGLSIADSGKDQLRAAASILPAWFARLYSAPAAQEPAPWQPSRLEYRFACGAASDGTDGRSTLVSEDYPGGHLDWYAFDINRRSRLEGPPGHPLPEPTVVRHAPLSFLPTPIEFGGMPNVRWWQFEDRKTHFGGIRASTTDLALLMLAEFGLIYGNDWILVPYDLAVGSFARIRGIVLTDVFGVRTFIRKAGSRPDDSWQHWNIYDLRDTSAPDIDPHLLLLPALGDRQEGPPIEKVTLTRDEMANMVFGIEETIPGEIGTGIGGAEAAAALENHFRRTIPVEVPDLVDTDAPVRYVAGTTVPENWIPFLPVQVSSVSGHIRLQRGRMARVIAGTGADTVAPRGEILRHGLDRMPPASYFVEDEEVPSDGTKVIRSFQRARWYDGRIYVWLGRAKTSGRGQGESGLRFDQIDPLTPSA